MNFIANSKDYLDNSIKKRQLISFLCLKKRNKIFFHISKINLFRVFKIKNKMKERSKRIMKLKYLNIGIRDMLIILL